jgi:hypothetical protein
MEIYVYLHYTIYGMVIKQRNKLRFTCHFHCQVEILWTYKNLQLQIFVDIFRTTGVKAVHAKKQLEITGLNDIQITNDID